MIQFQKMGFKKYFFYLINIFISINAIGQSISDSLVAHYSFDSNALDISGNGNHGTLFGPTAVPDRFGNANSAYLFNGSTDYIQYLSNNKFKPDTFPISISMWVKSNDNSIIGPLFKNDVVVDNYTGIWLQIHSSTGRVELSYGDGGTTTATSRRTKSGVMNVNDNQWHFIAGIIRGPTDMDLWIDCQYDGGTYSGSGSNLTYSNNGGSSGYFDVVGSTEYYQGAIDDIRFYNRALSQNDLQSLYISPLPYINPLLQNFNLGNDTSICGAGNIILAANTSFPGVQYNWSTGSTQSSINVNTIGTYWLQMSDNCHQKTDTINIQGSSINITASNDTSICSGSTITLWVAGNASNFVWTNNGINYYGSSITVSTSSPTSYYVYALDSICPSEVDTVNISIQNNISPPSFNTSGVICANSEFVFINNSPIGIDYLWNFGDPSSGANNTSIDYNGSHTFSQAGIYNVSLTIQGICGTDSITQAVTVIASPTTMASNDQIVCAGEKVLIAASGGDLYYWNNDIGSTSDSIYVYPDTTITYLVQAITNGCYGMVDSIHLTVLPLPTVNILGGTISCSGAPIQLMAGGNAQNYSWTGGYISSDDTIIFVGALNTDYILNGFDGNCVQTDTFRIANFKEIEASFNFIIDTCSRKIILTNNSTGSSHYRWGFDTQSSELSSPTFNINSLKEEETIQLIINPDTYCSDIASVNVELNFLTGDQLIVPNTFTPNNDLINDVFLLTSNFKCLPLKVAIYNRWGECVFKEESTTIAWDGSFKNKEVPPGVYFYFIEHNGQEIKGSVTLFR